MDTPTTMPWWRDLARYRPLVDDWEAFIAALERPRGATLQVNVARTDRAALAVLLAEDGVAAEPLAWRDGGLRLPSGVRPGLSWAYRAGLYQIQDEAAMVPVALLDPQPGERVLDLCAAPGNKTAQIALALGNRGTVVANDVKPGRLATVHHTIARLGLLNVSTTALDGRRFPPVAGGFDKVLVDAPCSAEGTATHGFVPASPAGFRQWVIGVQRGLLARAAALCRPGGRIVYATCTYAPEENEAVVDWVLRALPGLVRLVPARLAGLALSPGLTEWQGRRFAPALADTARLWPQRAGTGGFFIAVLERTDAPASDTAGHAPPAPMAAETGDAARDAAVAIARSCERFGLSPALFDGLRFVANSRHLRAVAEDHALPAGLAAQTSGLAFCRAGGRSSKLTTAAIQAFCRTARAHVIDLEPPQAVAYLRRESVFVDPRDGRGEWRGLVVLRHRGYAFGGGHLAWPDDGPGSVDSLFPTAWTGLAAERQPAPGKSGVTLAPRGG